MSEFNLYSVFDEVADEFGPVFQAKNDAVATRNYFSLIEQHQLISKDYGLFRLGTFDTEDGTILDVPDFPLQVVVSNFVKETEVE